jgi:hypothetical protein
MPLNKLQQLVKKQAQVILKLATAVTQVEAISYQMCDLPMNNGSFSKGWMKKFIFFLNLSSRVINFYSYNIKKGYNGDYCWLSFCMHTETEPSRIYSEYIAYITCHTHHNTCKIVVNNTT